MAHQNNLSAIDEALAKFDGSPTKLAAAIGGAVVRQNVEHWRSAGRVPSEHCPAVEAATGVYCEDLNPDKPWRRIPDKSWLHPKGRPVLDFAAALAEKEGA